MIINITNTVGINDTTDALSSWECGTEGRNGNGNIDRMVVGMGARVCVPASRNDWYVRGRWWTVYGTCCVCVLILSVYTTV